MPAHHRTVEVKLPEARVLADLYGIVFDLQTAAVLCEKAVEHSQKPQYDTLVVEGLVAAAVVRYGRCFSGGARFGLYREDMDELTDDAVATHAYFMNLRNKFIAHSVNTLEECYVTAMATERDGTKYPIEHLGGGQHRLVLSASTGKALAQLILQVKTIVEKRISAEKTRLLAIIQALPLEAIHNGDLHTPRRFKASDVEKSRRQTSHARRRPKSPNEGGKVR